MLPDGMTSFRHPFRVRTGIAILAVLLGRSGPEAQFGRGRFNVRVATPDDYDGVVPLLPRLVPQRHGRRRRQLVGRLSSRRHQSVDSARGADEDARQPERASSSRTICSSGSPTTRCFNARS